MCIALPCKIIKLNGLQATVKAFNKEFTAINLIKAKKGEEVLVQQGIIIEKIKEKKKIEKKVKKRKKKKNLN